MSKFALGLALAAALGCGSLLVAAEKAAEKITEKASPLTGEMPRSLSERVKLAGGALELSRGMGVTKISVSLPIGGRLQ